MEIIHVFYMAMFLAFVIVLAVYLKKHGSLIKGKQSNILELERFYYSPKSYVSILKIGKENVVLGITESNINYLKELTDKETLDQLFLKESLDKEKTKFGDILKLRKESIDGIKIRLEKMRLNQNEET